MPSVRGRERVVVVALLTSSAASTGALAGWVGGVAWSALLGPALNVWALGALVVGCVALDAVRLAPFSVRRQVPQLWGRIFSASVVALLYGARLGVGPLTILRTWLWWGAFVAASSAGPWWGAGAGAMFGLVRVGAMLAAGTRAGGLQSRERPVAWVLAAAALVALVAGGALVERDGPAAARAILGRTADDGAVPLDAGRDIEDEAVAPAPSTTSPTTPAAPAPDPIDAALAGLLPATLLPGWTRAADDPRRHLGALDLAAAAAAEADTSAETALLETRHFRRGHARGWRGPRAQVGYASVYEFASPSDAAAYLVDGVTTIEGRGARVYDVAVPAGGKGFSQAGRAAATEGSTISHGVVFVEGSRFFLVFVSGNDSSVDPAVAAEAARSVAGA